MYNKEKLRQMCLKVFERMLPRVMTWNFDRDFNGGYFWTQNPEFHIDLRQSDPLDPKCFYDISLWSRHDSYDYYDLYKEVKGVNPITPPEFMIARMIKEYRLAQSDIDCLTTLEFLKRLNQ